MFFHWQRGGSPCPSCGRLWGVLESSFPRWQKAPGSGSLWPKQSWYLSLQSSGRRINPRAERRCSTQKQDGVRQGVHQSCQPQPCCHKCPPRGQQERFPQQRWCEDRDGGAGRQFPNRAAQGSRSPARGGTASSPQGLRYLNAALPYLTALIAQTPSQHAPSRPSANKFSPQIQTA